MKKFLIIIASLVLDIIILGGITLGCYFISTLANFCLNLLSLILTIVCIFMLVANYIYDKQITKKYSNMTNEDQLNFVLSKREWVKDNIVTLRDDSLKSYKKAFAYGLFVLLLLYITFIVNGISGVSLDFYLTSLCFALMFAILGVINFISIYIKLSTLVEKKEVIRDGGFDVLKKFVKETLKEENLDYDVNIEIYNEANCSISLDKNKVLQITIGWILLKSLTNDELKAVLFHEIAHFHNLDLEYSQIFNKTRTAMHFFFPSELYKILCPAIGYLEINNEINTLLASIYYENKADDEVVKKNIAEDSVNATIKLFGLSQVHNLDYPAVDYKCNTDMKWNDDSIALDFKVRCDQYNKHIDFYELASLKHCSERFATHPNIRERREKFNVNNINIKIIENHYFDEDIKKYYDRNNEYCFEKKSCEKYIRNYNEYTSLKEKVSDDDIKLLNDLAERAMSIGEYEDAKRFARRVLELNPKKERAMYILGFILVAIDHNEEGLDYLNYLIEETSNEYKFAAFRALGNYYVHTGNEEEVERVRNMQVGVLDDTDEYDDLLTLKPNDTLTVFTNQEVVNKIVEIAKENKEVSVVMMGVKKVKELTCCHVIVFHKEVNDKQAFQDTMHNIFTYLDILEEQYNLLRYHYLAIEKNKKVFDRSLIVYSKE